jgi:hypothetical protein
MTLESSRKSQSFSQKWLNDVQPWFCVFSATWIVQSDEAAGFGWLDRALGM